MVEVVVVVVAATHTTVASETDAMVEMAPATAAAEVAAAEVAAAAMEDHGDSGGSPHR